MKYVKILLAVALVFTLCSMFSLKKGEHKSVYAFGVPTSLTDTVIYYTEIQVLDSVVLDKNGFLSHREIYSYQLKNYLEIDKGQSSRTRMIYFSESQKKLEKETARVLGKYKKNQSVALEKIDIQSSKFTKSKE